MDLQFDATADDNVPPIPNRHHIHVSQREARDLQPRPSRNSRRQSPQRTARPVIPPASPEVISNLITSLSAISQPTSSHFESHPAAVNFALPTSPVSPSSGSFGVDYGAYTRSEPEEPTQDPTSLDNLAASPPIVRTSKPTSGYSPLTGPKSPSTRSTSRESGSGLRSFIRSNSVASRPSSPASATSKNDDTHSIGNLSIERGSAPTPELKHHRSHDSWGKKTGRSTKGLMYMSSKERLREREFERKRLPRRSGSQSESGRGTPNSTMNNGARPDPSLAETVINEEPGSHSDSPGLNEPKKLDSPQPIPARDSSLRKSRTHQKRTSARRSKRDGDTPASIAIPETEEHVASDVPPQSPQQQQQHTRTGSETGTQGKSFLLGPEECPASPVSASRAPQPLPDLNMEAVNYNDEGAAPFPAVSQRRRESHSAERSSSRLSGRLSPAPKEALRVKRSSSRLKRLSGPLSPRSESRSSAAASPEPAQQAQQQAYPAGYERPGSADSVDDAVESYLCSPRLSQKIRHPQTGRVISFSEVGDANGSAVFCCVGMGLTRYITAFYDELALTLKLRLITPDRPGVGDSEPYADGTTTPLSWPGTYPTHLCDRREVQLLTGADDVYAICQALKITKFSILAHSAGAIYALATALRMPQHIRGRIHLLAPWIPPSQMNVFGGSQTLPPTNAIPTSQKILRALPTPLLKAANSSFMTATSSSITSSLPKNPRRAKRKSNTHGKDNNTGNRNAMQMNDKENLNSTAQGKDKLEGGQAENGFDSPNMSEHMDQIQPVGGNGVNGGSVMAESTLDIMTDKERQMTYDTRLTHAIWELATTGANPAVDLLVCLERRHTIGFRYVDITRPVVIHHGSRDTRVPVENVKWLGKTMRRCEVRVLEGEGHGLMASATVMGSVLMEMSKEWEDWMRLTGADGRKDRERGRRGTIVR
ncbi:hydrolase [Metarhizium acridum CQMa 102]|uniref:Hydrolase n=1 Tax=Metarhizium acridum (strain CQMa 102) TaxID=655827 RepID=E9E753_METAQ|nr:hydrolase [Metarhizium acridum CQMa 102]EFY88228.1 hydrolase [Metarhizium acridum CQMa 102]